MSRASIVPTRRDRPAPVAGDTGRLARLPAALMLAGALVALGVLAAVLVPWQWVPGGHLTPVGDHRLFTDAQLHRIDGYNHLRRWLAWPAYFLALLVSVVLGFTAAGSRLVRRVAGRLRWWVAVPLGALVLVLIGWLVTLPFDLALRSEDLRYGLSRQGLAGWLGDHGISFVVAWVTAAIVGLVVVGLARGTPRWWFAWAGGLVLVLTFAGSFIYPVVVEPLFNSFTPLPHGQFRASVFRLSAREGVHLSDVLVSNASKQTTTDNAYVSGFGSTRRLVVYDNLLTDLTPAQARVVIAHELGHAKNHDVLVGTGLGAVGGVAAVGLGALVLDTRWVRRRAGIARVGEPEAVAVVLALVAIGTFLVSPLENAVSRSIEARADRVSIQATHQSHVFVTMQRRIARSALVDPSPPALSQFWWGTHPTPDQRAGLPASLRAAGDLK